MKVVYEGAFGGLLLWSSWCLELQEFEGLHLACGQLFLWGSEGENRRMPLKRIKLLWSSRRVLMLWTAAQHKSRAWCCLSKLKFNSGFIWSVPCRRGRDRGGRCSGATCRCHPRSARWCIRWSCYRRSSEGSPRSAAPSSCSGPARPGSEEDWEALQREKAPRWDDGERKGFNSC